jgi:hypothetical protein
MLEITAEEGQWYRSNWHKHPLFASDKALSRG